MLSSLSILNSSTKSSVETKANTDNKYRFLVVENISFLTSVGLGSNSKNSSPSLVILYSSGNTIFYRVIGNTGADQFLMVLFHMGPFYTAIVSYGSFL